MNRYLCLLVLVVVASAASAQEELKSKYYRIMDEGVLLMDQGNYEEASAKFRIVLDNLKVLPDDMAFYIGKNSYFQGKYKQSIDWLSKYIELKGTRGRFFNEGVDLLDKAEQAYLVVREVQNEKLVEDLTDGEFDCPDSGKVSCPVCKGKGVIVRDGVFGKEFRTCRYSDQHGFMTCEEYQLLLQGKLKPRY